MRPTTSHRVLIGFVLAFSLQGGLRAQAAAPQPPARLPPPVQEQTPGPTPGGPYTVGPADVLKIQVFNEDQLSGAFRVDPDGSISYAMLGRLHVAGRTERDIATVIEKLLADGWINKPQVAVQVAEYRSRTIFIAGEVRTPGKYPLQGDNSLLEVLALAGSLSGNASNEVIVVRPRNAADRIAPALPDAGTDAEVIRVDLQAIEQGRMSGNIQLQDGDTVFVPRAERIFISGHVRSPGAYPYSKGMTIQQAIAVAGGLSDRGSSRGIKIRREIRPGAGEYKDVSVKMTDMVQPNDTITVRQRLI